MVTIVTFSFLAFLVLYCLYRMARIQMRQRQYEEIVEKLLKTSELLAFNYAGLAQSTKQIQENNAMLSSELQEFEVSMAEFAVTVSNYMDSRKPSSGTPVTVKKVDKDKLN